MDIQQLRNRKQLNVQQQETLRRAAMLDTAVAFQRGDSRFCWVRQALDEKKVSASDGLVIHEASTPCGAGESSSIAIWLSFLGAFVEMEATTYLDSSKLKSLERFEDVTHRMTNEVFSGGSGRGVGPLALEVLAELRDSANYSLKRTDQSLRD
jgi:hypothetical protein